MPVTEKVTVPLAIDAVEVIVALPPVPVTAVLLLSEMEPVKLPVTVAEATFAPD